MKLDPSSAVHAPFSFLLSSSSSSASFPSFPQTPSNCTKLIADLDFPVTITRRFVKTGGGGGVGGGGGGGGGVGGGGDGGQISDHWEQLISLTPASVYSHTV